MKAVCGSFRSWVKVMADSLSGRGTKGAGDELHELLARHVGR